MNNASNVPQQPSLNGITTRRTDLSAKPRARSKAKAPAKSQAAEKELVLDKTFDITLTPELASRLLDEFRYEGQRRLSERHVETLIHEHLAGRFADPLITVAFCGGKGFLINGQHSCTVVVRTGISVRATMRERYVDSMDSVADLYGQIDRGKIRSHQDCISATGVLARIGMTGYHGSLLAAAAGLIIIGFRRSSHNIPAARSPKDRADTMEQWHQEFERYLEAIEGAESRVGRALRRGAVASVGMVTFRADPSVAYQFWAGVAQSVADREDPRNKLERWLGTGVTGYSERDNANTARYVAHAWNRFYEGKPLKQWKVQHVDAPIYIAGSEYTGEDE